ncbi:hypothetical protein [Actinoplanes palleronii]|uniref:Uncharacterized protein n=1 Tax=Actinoplanes palleronii TaxID=113570 RepID=A0ABQ4BSI5_9ACTN|nr:hypothetical protein [Actinoplanes palleronii]GIE73659.1 hypothetical protein Apa02nite_097670 [Actinoplanes palleronii]
MNGGIYLLAEEIARKLGLEYGQPGRIPETADRWSFRDGTRYELLDPTGTLLAGFMHAADPQWRAAAHARGKVLVLYGGQLGVRRPPGATEVGYDVRARDAELHTSLAAGTVLTASINYIHE